MSIATDDGLIRPGSLSFGETLTLQGDFGSLKPLFGTDLGPQLRDVTITWTSGSTHICSECGQPTTGCALLGVEICDIEIKGDSAGVGFWAFDIGRPRNGIRYEPCGHHRSLREEGRQA